MEFKGVEIRMTEVGNLSRCKYSLMSVGVGVQGSSLKRDVTGLEFKKDAKKKSRVHLIKKNTKSGTPLKLVQKRILKKV